MNNKFFEWAGVVTAILYSLFVALNIGIEFLGFGHTEEVIREYSYYNFFMPQRV